MLGLVCALPACMTPFSADDLTWLYGMCSATLQRTKQQSGRKAALRVDEGVESDHTFMLH